MATLSDTWQHPGGKAICVPVSLSRSLLIVVLLLSGLAVVFLAGEHQSESTTSENAVAEQVSFEPVIFPGTSTDGVLAVEISEGAYAAFGRDQPGFVVPPVVTLKAGDRIEITNKDSGAHMIFYAFVPPGTTVSMPFDTPGMYTYSSGCAVNPKMNSFTTVIVTA